MAVYRVEVTREDNTNFVITMDDPSSFERAKDLAQRYHDNYGYDVVIKEINAVYVRRTVNE